MRWSALNRDYNTDVLAGWQNNGCLEEIKKRLGYRFILQKATMPDSLKPGSTFNMNFDVYNHGFANPYNPRLLEIILRNIQSKATYRLVTNVDPRFWHPEDTVHVEIHGGIPVDLPQGSYQVLLHLADPVEALRYRPEYAIQLANVDTWEDSTGFNDLHHTLVINNQASGMPYTGQNFFEFFKAGGNNHVVPQAKIVIDGNFDDWKNVPQIDVYPDEENAGDALNDDVDLTDLWLTNDSNNVYISYQVKGEIKANYFYHVFFDTDNDTSTGFHSANSYMGIDYMVENGSLWKYSGQNGAWGWTYVGSAVMAQGTMQKGRVEMAVAKSDLELADTVRTLQIIFNVNDLDDNYDDDYAPNAYQDHSYVYHFVPTAIFYSEMPRIPKGFCLRAFPNPFNSAVQIHFRPLQSPKIQAKIYDVQGRVVKSFKKLNPGQSSLIWRGLDDTGDTVSSGLYIFQLKSQSQVQEIKIMFIK